MRRSSVFAALGGFGVAGRRPRPVRAHHSFAAEFDRERTITVTGTMQRLEWTNPHARIYVQGKDETGKDQLWDFELGPPNGLMRNGWRRDSLKQGHRDHGQRLPLQDLGPHRQRAHGEAGGRPPGVRRLVVRDRRTGGEIVVGSQLSVVGYQSSRLH